jgi:SAM-dependent methyltransferase
MLNGFSRRPPAIAVYGNMFSIVNILKLYQPILRHFRAARMKRFARELAFDERTTVLDMGGDLFVWTLLEARPKLTILNLRERTDKAAWVHYLVGDGCNTGLPDGYFDIVFSNSVIEHVGDAERQRQFARECIRCGKAFFVQTPNKWFPFDLHTLTPFIHWLPKPMFIKLMPLSVRFLISSPETEAVEDFTNMRLLSRRELADLFPGARIIEERFLGMTKSLIAVSALPSPNQKSATSQNQEACGNVV